MDENIYELSEMYDIGENLERENRKLKEELKSIKVKIKKLRELIKEQDGEGAICVKCLEKVDANKSISESEHDNDNCILFTRESIGWLMIWKDDVSKILNHLINDDIDV